MGKSMGKLENRWENQWENWKINGKIGKSMGNRIVGNAPGSSGIHGFSPFTVPESTENQRKDGGKDGESPEKLVKMG